MSPSKPGTSPGTLTPQPDARPTQVNLLRYNGAHAQAIPLAANAQLDQVLHVDPEQVLWCDVCGLGNLQLIQEIGRHFAVHPLALADLVNTPQRPKAEAYGDITLCIVHMVRCGQQGRPIIEQIGVVLGNNWVLTVQEDAADGDVLDPVRTRILNNRGKIRTLGADYLAYAILDCVVDAFFPALDQLGQRLEVLELAALSKPEPATGRHIYELKRALLNVRRSAWPMREALSVLHRDDELMAPAVHVYLRDAVDHATQVVDLVETYREFAASLMDLYLSSVNNRMNEVVKLLTIISTIFLPLSFIAGLYGMNFDTAAAWNMPELKWRFGYLYALILMAGVAGGMIWYFRRAGWLGSSDIAEPEPIDLQEALEPLASPMPTDGSIAQLSHDPHHHD